jgi:hypothetical protein
VRSRPFFGCNIDPHQSVEAPDKAPRATAKSAARLSGRPLAVRRASRHEYGLASRFSEASGVVATVNLPLIDRGFALHGKAHGQKGSPRRLRGLQNGNQDSA